MIDAMFESLKIRHIITIIYMVFLFFLSFNLIQSFNKKQQLSYELTELNSIKYGLFNVDNWKDKVANIIIKKIDEYSLNSENKEYIRGYIEAGFYKLLDELADFLQNEKNKGNWFEQIVKNVVYGISFDKKSFKTQVPIWANEIMILIENPTTQQQLKQHLTSRIVKLINDSKSLQEKTVLNNILLKHQFTESKVSDCKKAIERKINSTETTIYIYSVITLIICLIPFILTLITQEEIESIIFLKIISLFSLLLIGISTPMLSIDVRLNSFDFMLLGEKISFKNQVLYFQSKSILQVVKILLTTATFNSIITGFFIFIFSIIFPITKLFSVFYESFTGFTTNLTSFFIEKAGKW